MDKTLRQKLTDELAAGREKYLWLLKKLVSYDSRMLDGGRSGQEREIQQFLKQYLHDLGAEVDAFSPDNEKISRYAGFNAGHDYRDRENVVAIFKGSGDGRSILLNGHCDVVPPGDGEKWTSPPFAPEVRENRLYGRGSADMKGGLAAAICAIELLSRCGVKPAGDIILESVIAEESGGNGTIACCDRGYRADGAILMEPTGLRVMPANRGAFLAEFSVTGAPIHASMRGFGVNAIDKAIRLIGALRELELKWLLTKAHPLLGNPTINIGQIEGGEGASIVPESCTVRFDVEFFPAEADERGEMRPVDPETVKREVQMALDRACQGDEWLTAHPVTVNWYQETLCFQTDPEDAFVRSVSRSCEQVLGKAVLGGLPCGCDGAQLSHIGKMPVVVLGPGDVKEAHTIDESLPLEEYYNAILLYADLIVSWTENERAEDEAQ